MSSSNEPLFSIVVPAYNAASTIDLCIKSIQSQTLTDFQAIIIDDGSHDETLSIAKGLVEHDKRFQVVSQLNVGVSEARNHGLDLATGRFVVFVDSDDIINEEMLSEFAKLANDDERYTLLMSGIAQKSHAKETYFTGLFNNPGDGTSFSADIPSLIGNKQLLSPWAKAYSRHEISKNSIRFRKDLNIGEDLTFNLDFLRNSQSYKSTEYIGYVYMVDSEGSLSKKVSAKTFKNYDNLYTQNINFCTDLELGKKAEAAFAVYYLSSVYYGLGLLADVDVDEYRSVMRSLDRGILHRAAASAVHAGVVGLGLSLPVLINSRAIFGWFVGLRRSIKRRIR